MDHFSGHPVHSFNIWLSVLCPDLVWSWTSTL